MFKETHPIIGTRDVRRAMTFYTQLGFKVAFGAGDEDADAQHRPALATNNAVFRSLGESICTRRQYQSVKAREGSGCREL